MLGQISLLCQQLSMAHISSRTCMLSHNFIQIPKSYQCPEIPGGRALIGTKWIYNVEVEGKGEERNYRVLKDFLEHRMIVRKVKKTY